MGILILIVLFIYAFNKCLLNDMPSTFLCIEDSVLSKKENSLPLRAYDVVEKRNNKHLYK